MSAPPPSRFVGRSALAAFLVAVLVVLPGLGNSFAYDDVPIIVENTAIQAPQTLGPRLLEPYWPQGLFRPLTLAMFGLEWQVADGSPLPFHLANTLLYGLLTGGLVLLAHGLGAPPLAALLGGLAFAVHPVHSEATANIVGQAELLSALGVLAAVLLFIRARRRGGPNWRETVGILVLFVLAVHAKESGYVLPGLLVAVEWLALPPTPGTKRDLAKLRVPALLLAAVFLGSLAVRARLIGGIGGEIPHLSWLGMETWERGVAMLGVVPEWARLLFWPLRLQAEYGPPALVPVSTITLTHLVGIVILLSAVALLAWCHRRIPLAALGLAWVAIAMAPVANVLFPTGIIVAERTLFLPSVGVALIVAGVAGSLGTRLGPVGARMAVTTAALLLAGAGVRSAMRQTAWHDTVTIMAETTRDAPRVYRGHYILGKAHLANGDREAAKASFAEATRLWDRDARPFEELGQLLRAEGNCAAAIPVLEQAVVADSSSDRARSRMIECLIVERRWDEAEAEIGRGLAQGVSSYQDALRRVRAGRDGGAAGVP